MISNEQARKVQSVVGRRCCFIASLLLGGGDLELSLCFQYFLPLSLFFLES
jgi:hypothetical protein